MVRPLAQPHDLARLLADARFTALLIGPGAGVDDATREQALAMLATGRPVVLDADALSVFAERPGELFEAIRGRLRAHAARGRVRALVRARPGDKLSRARAAARIAAQ